MTSWWARWRLISPASRLFPQPFIQGADQRKHQSSASLAFMGELTGDRSIPRTKCNNAEMFPFDDVMINTAVHSADATLVYVEKGVLTPWGRVTDICISKLCYHMPGQRQAIIWTNAGKLLITPLGRKFNEILIEIHIFLYKKIHLKMSSGKCRPFCLGLNV